jgi:hypothetical protein
MDIYGIYFIMTLIKCSIGMLLFLINILKRIKLENKKCFILIIPQIISSLFLLYNCINIFIMNYYEGGMTVPTLIMAFGGLSWMCYWILYNNTIFKKLILRISLCIIMPINLIVLYIIIWGLIGI